MEQTPGPAFDRRALLRNAALLGISVPDPERPAAGVRRLADRHRRR